MTKSIKLTRSTRYLPNKRTTRKVKTGFKSSIHYDYTTRYGNKIKYIFPKKSKRTIPCRKIKHFKSTFWITEIDENGIQKRRIIRKY